MSNVYEVQTYVDCRWRSYGRHATFNAANLEKRDAKRLGFNVRVVAIPADTPEYLFVGQSMG